MTGSTESRQVIVTGAATTAESVAGTGAEPSRQIEPGPLSCQESRHGEPSPITCGKGAISTPAPEGSESRQRIVTRWEDPWGTRRAGLRRSLQRARWFEQDLARGRVENAAALAQREGLSRARVSQLLRLLRLAPAIIEELDDVTVHGPVPREYDLRKLADGRSPEAQVAAYRRLCTAESKKRKARKVKPCRVAGRRDWRHLFDRARRYHLALTTKRVASIAALARAEGISGSRVGQILVLLYLAPDIIEQLEATCEPMKGVTEKALRKIARMEDRGEQREAFARLASSAGR